MVHTLEAVRIHPGAAPSPAELAGLLNVQAEIINVLISHISTLERSLEHLMDGQPVAGDLATLEAFAIAPTIRLRINHSHTLKEGWRLSETTVEWSGPGKPDETAIQDALLTAQHLGQREAARRVAPRVVEGAIDDDVAF